MNITNDDSDSDSDLELARDGAHHPNDDADAKGSGRTDTSADGEPCAAVDGAPGELPAAATSGCAEGQDGQEEIEVTEEMISAGLLELSLSCDPGQCASQISGFELAAVYRAMARERS
jgi:hypothetical protein